MMNTTLEMKLGKRNAYGFLLMDDSVLIHAWCRCSYFCQGKKKKIFILISKWYFFQQLGIKWFSFLGLVKTFYPPLRHAVEKIQTRRLHLFGLISWFDTIWANLGATSRMRLYWLSKQRADLSWIKIRLDAANCPKIYFIIARWEGHSALWIRSPISRFFQGSFLTFYGLMTIF